MKSTKNGFGTGIYLLVLAFLLGGIVAVHAQVKVHNATVIIWGSGELESTIIEYPNGDVSMSSVTEAGDVVVFTFKDGLQAFGLKLVYDKPNRINIIYQNKIVGRIFW